MKIENQACPRCGKAFKERMDLLTHVKKVHLNGRDPACCNMVLYPHSSQTALATKKAWYRINKMPIQLYVLTETQHY